MKLKLRLHKEKMSTEHVKRNCSSPISTFFGREKRKQRNVALILGFEYLSLKFIIFKIDFSYSYLTFSSQS